MFKDKQGDELSNRQKLLTELIEHYGEDVLKIAYLNMKSKDLAEDVFQETFIKVSQNLDDYKSIHNIKSWIIKITLNTCRDMMRTPWNKKIVLIDDLRKLDDDAECLERYNSRYNSSNLNDYIWSVLRSMPEIYRSVLILYSIDDYNIKEISEILNISEANTRTRLSRARTEFKKVYERNVNNNERLS